MEQQESGPVAMIAKRTMYCPALATDIDSLHHRAKWQHNSFH